MEENKKLNPEQLEAVQYGTGPLLIIAGAGTGKTTVITERIKWLVSQDLAKPSEILALTFTDKASREMEERVDVAMPMGYTQMWISTFHAFCDRILRNEGLHIGLSPNYNLLTEAETIQLLRQNLFKFELNYFRPLGNPNKFIEGMIQHFSRLKDEDVLPEEYLKFAQEYQSVIASEAKQSLRKNEIASSLSAPRNDATEERQKYLELANAYKTYEELKVKEGVMDFSDLIANTLKLFRTRKNVLAQYQQQFKYFLVDEFQDTNYAQYELLKVLAPPKTSPNLTVVGDDSQSIYKFRGAAISNILQFMKEYKGAHQVVLTSNYRSTQTILDNAYKLIKHNDPDTLEVKLGISKNLKKMRKVREVPVDFIYTDRVENEAEAVAKIIENCKLKSENLDYKDFAILVRANNHADAFTRALARHGLPYQFLGPGMLFRQPEVKDLIAYLKVLANFDDSVAMYRVLAMDIFEILPRDLSAMTNYSKKYNLSLFEAGEQINKIFVSPKTRETVEKLVKMISRHLGLIKKETAGQILYFFLEESGLLRKITNYSTEAEEKRAQNISKFFDKLKTYEAEHEEASVFVVSDWIDLSLELGESPLAADMDWTEIEAVNLLTVHSSKGLEFPIVFLVNLVNNRFPTSERREQIPIPEDLIKEILPVGDYHLEEERRLFYVGMTRARDRLFLTAANYYGEGKRERKISAFVVEALGELPLKTKQPTEEAQLSLLEWSKQKEVPLSIIRPPLSINYLSFSQIEAFNHCPLQYRYRFIQKIPVPQNAAQTFGDTIHRTLRDFLERVKSGQKPKEQEIWQFFEANWSSIGYSDKTHENKLKQEGKRMLRDFYKHFDPKVTIKDLEKSFLLRLTPDLKIRGKIDRVDEKNGRLEVIDYKTGKESSQKEVDQSLQMTIYALAASDQNLYGKKPEEITLTFYFLENQEKKSSERTTEEIKKAREDIVQKAKEIEQSTFEAKPGPLCKFCDFKLICEAWT